MIQHRCHISPLRLVCLGFFAVCLLGIAAPRTSAQDVDLDKPATSHGREIPSDANLKKNQFAVRKMLQNGQFANDAERAMFDDFYTKYALPRWTAPGIREELPEKARKDLRNDLNLASRATSPKAHEALNELVLQFMDKELVQKKDIDPAVRVNAMLMIGELVEPKTAKPLPAAVPVLLDAVKSANQLDAVKVAALVGLTRHAALGIENADSIKQITARMVELAAAAPPAGQATAAYCWMRGQAAEILGRLQSPGQSGEVAKALGKMVADEALPLAQRCLAAKALGQLDYSGATLNPAPYLAAVGKLAEQILAEEVQMAKDQQSEPLRRRVRCRLEGPVEAIKALAAISSGAQQTFAAALQTPLESCLQTLDGRSPPEGARLESLLEQTRAAVEAALKKAPK